MPDLAPLPLIRHLPGGHFAVLCKGRTLSQRLAAIIAIAEARAPDARVPSVQEG